MNGTKEWWKSKTLWWNVLAVVFLILQTLGVAEVAVDPQVEALVLAVVNMILRFRTRQRLVV